MTEYRTIDIDFDVYKLIQTELRSFDEKPNDALRRLLKLPPKPATPANVAPPSGGRPWSGEGVTLSHGTRVRMRYNRRLYEGEIVDGRWVIEGKTFDTPSGAASGTAVTKRGKPTRLDGWIYWEAQLPGDTDWKPIRSMRPAVHSRITVEETLEEMGL